MDVTGCGVVIEITASPPWDIRDLAGALRVAINESETLETLSPTIAAVETVESLRFSVRQIAIVLPWLDETVGRVERRLAEDLATLRPHLERNGAQAIVPGCPGGPAYSSAEIDLTIRLRFHPPAMGNSSLGALAMVWYGTEVAAPESSTWVRVACPDYSAPNVSTAAPWTGTVTSRDEWDDAGPRPPICVQGIPRGYDKQVIGAFATVVRNLRDHSGVIISPESWRVRFADELQSGANRMAFVLTDLDRHVPWEDYKRLVISLRQHLSEFTGAHSKGLWTARVTLDFNGKQSVLTSPSSVRQAPAKTRRYPEKNWETVRVDPPRRTQTHSIEQSATSNATGLLGTQNTKEQPPPAADLGAIYALHPDRFIPWEEWIAGLRSEVLSHEEEGLLAWYADQFEPRLARLAVRGPRGPNCMIQTIDPRLAAAGIAGYAFAGLASQSAIIRLDLASPRGFSRHEVRL